MLCAGMQGHYLLGLRILNLLVTEMNQPTQGRTLTQHRKLAVAFRDNALLKVFQLAIGSLRTLAPPAQCSSKLQEQVCHSVQLLLLGLQSKSSKALSQHVCGPGRSIS